MLVCTQYLDDHKEFLRLDRHIQESTSIDLKSVECERSDGSKFGYLEGDFDVIMDAIS